MKKQTLTTIILTIVVLFAFKAKAQDGYTYTLIDNGSYNYTIGAVPNTSANNFPTSVQSYGFTIILPDGVTASVTSSLGGAASATFFDGNAIGQATIDGYLITETLGSPVGLPAPSAGTTSNIVTIQVNGAPTSGSMYILENNSALATTITPLKSFMQADMIDNGMAEFVNVVDPNAVAVSGMSTFNFSTLSTTDFELIENEVKIYPNPTTSVLNIRMKTNLKQATIYSILGTQVLQTNFTQIHTANLKSGIYVIEIEDETGSISTKRFIKQ